MNKNLVRDYEGSPRFILEKSKDFLVSQLNLVRNYLGIPRFILGKSKDFLVSQLN